MKTWMYLISIFPINENLKDMQSDWEDGVECCERCDSTVST